VLLASACAPTRPDLTRLYQNADDNPAQPPVIIIHGLTGSTLVDAKTGKQFWPGSLGTLTFSNFTDLRQMSAEDREGEGLVPGTLMYDVAGVDFYGELLHTLESIGRFERSTPGHPAGGQRRRYYVLLYDWRKDNIIAVRKLHAMIEQIRRDYGDPALRVDIIAHSNGGQITNYYLALRSERPAGDRPADAVAGRRQAHPPRGDAGHAGCWAPSPAWNAWSTAPAWPCARCRWR
jgi:pimeloyl-ACP methyl ester carboxylesterase